MMLTAWTFNQDANTRNINKYTANTQKQIMTLWQTSFTYILLAFSLALAGPGDICHATLHLKAFCRLQISAALWEMQYISTL